jgi:hypothetical protein
MGIRTLNTSTRVPMRDIEARKSLALRMGMALHVIHREQSSKLSYVIFRDSSLQVSQQISRNTLGLLKVG